MAAKAGGMLPGEVGLLGGSRLDVRRATNPERGLLFMVGVEAIGRRRC
jgi:hypothetical protein